MEVTLALLCEAANVAYDGKLNVHGEFSRLGPISFPFSPPNMCLALRFSASEGEVGQRCRITIAATDQRSEQVGELNAELTAPPPEVAGYASEMLHIIDLSGSRFERSGPHTFHILVDNEEKARIPLALIASQSIESEDDDGV